VAALETMALLLMGKLLRLQKAVTLLQRELSLAMG